MDPEDLGISTTSRTYANAVDRRQDRLNEVYAPYMSAITDRLSMGDVTKRGYRVAWDLDDYLRADPSTRWNVHKTAVEMGVMTPDEVRVSEDLPGKAPVPAASTPPAPARAPLRAVPDVSRETSRAAGFAADLMTFEAMAPGVVDQAS